MNNSKTPFSFIYNFFFIKITDDMYMELTELDTYRMLSGLLESAILKFEFPRVNLSDYELEEICSVSTYKGVESNGEEVIAYIYNEGCFNVELSKEEMNIIAIYMVVEWIGYQLASVENTRMKYSGSDFKLTSQANHMGKLQSMKKEYEREGFHMQRLYSRRFKADDGRYYSSMVRLIEPLKKLKKKNN